MVEKPKRTECLQIEISVVRGGGRPTSDPLVGLLVPLSDRLSAVLTVVSSEHRRAMIGAECSRAVSALLAKHLPGDWEVWATLDKQVFDLPAVDYVNYELLGDWDATDELAAVRLVDYFQAYIEPGGLPDWMNDVFAPIVKRLETPQAQAQDLVSVFAECWEIQLIIKANTPATVRGAHVRSGEIAERARAEAAAYLMNNDSAVWSSARMLLNKMVLAGAPRFEAAKFVVEVEAYRQHAKLKNASPLVGGRPAPDDPVAEGMWRMIECRLARPTDDNVIKREILESSVKDDETLSELRLLVIGDTQPDLGYLEAQF